MRSWGKDRFTGAVCFRDLFYPEREDFGQRLTLLYSRGRPRAAAAPDAGGVKQVPHITYSLEPIGRCISLFQSQATGHPSPTSWRSATPHLQLGAGLEEGVALLQLFGWTRIKYEASVCLHSGQFVLSPTHHCCSHEGLTTIHPSREHPSIWGSEGCLLVCVWGKLKLSKSWPGPPSA